MDLYNLQIDLVIFFKNIRLLQEHIYKNIFICGVAVMLNRILVIIIFSFIFHLNASAMERVQRLSEQLRHNPLEAETSPGKILVKQQEIAQDLGELIAVGKGCSRNSFQRVCTKKEGLRILAGLVKCVVLKSPDEMRQILNPPKESRPQAPLWQMHIANCRKFSEVVRALWSGNTHALWGEKYREDRFVNSPLAHLLKRFDITNRQELIDFVVKEASSDEIRAVVGREGDSHEHGIFTPQFEAQEKQREINNQMQDTQTILKMSPEEQKTYRENLFYKIGLARGIEQLNLCGQELYDFPFALTRLSNLQYLGLRGYLLLNYFKRVSQQKWASVGIALAIPPVYRYYFPYGGGETRISLTNGLEDFLLNA